MRIVRTAHFDRSLKKLGATEADVARLMAAIVARPGAGDVVAELGGARKIRFAMKGRGKRGGGRAIYLMIWRGDTAFLLLAYSKSDQSDLSERQRAMIQVLAEELSNG